MGNKTRAKIANYIVETEVMAENATPDEDLIGVRFFEVGEGGNENRLRKVYELEFALATFAQRITDLESMTVAKSEVEAATEAYESFWDRSAKAGATGAGPREFEYVMAFDLEAAATWRKANKKDLEERVAELENEIECNKFTMELSIGTIDGMNIACEFLIDRNRELEAELASRIAHDEDMRLEGRGVDR